MKNSGKVTLPLRPIIWRFIAALTLAYLLLLVPERHVGHHANLLFFANKRKQSLIVRNILSPVLLGCLFGLVAPSVSLFAQNSETKPLAASETRFRFEAGSDKSLALWEGDQPVLVYNHGVISKPGVSPTRNRSTYIHPIYDLDGEVLTDDFPRDHEYHRGLYWAWPHIKIGAPEAAEIQKAYEVYRATTRLQRSGEK